MGPMATILNIMDNKKATTTAIYEQQCAFHAYLACHITSKIASDTILYAKIAILIVKNENMYAYSYNRK